MSSTLWKKKLLKGLKVKKRKEKKRKEANRSGASLLFVQGNRAGVHQGTKG